MPDKPPLWVRFTLFGVPSRRFALGCSALALAIGAGATWFVATSDRVNPERRLLVCLVISVTAAIAALGYLLAVRWADRHGGWN